MAFKVFGDQRDTEDILVVRVDESALSSLKSQDALFQGGHIFEASVARAALVEGLLLMYLLCAKQVRRAVLDADTESRLQRGRITMGQIKDALVRAAAFHDQQLEIDVTAFVKDRNHLAHHLAVGIRPFDFKAFFDNGCSIAWSIWNHILKETEAHRRANP